MLYTWDVCLHTILFDQCGVLCRINRWRCLQDPQLLHTFFGQCIYFIISKDVCVGSNFAYDDVVLRVFIIFTTQAIRSLLG